MTTPFLQLPLPLHTGTTAPCAHTSSGYTSQFNFKSSVNHKYLSTRAPTLTSTLGEGTAFQLDAENYLMQNGNYLTVRYLHNGFIEFFTSPNPDVQWVGSHLVRKNSGMVVDIYSSESNSVCLWKRTGHDHQKWKCINVQEQAECTHDFTLATYNCLYTEHTRSVNLLSEYEVEMVYKTQEYEKYRVKKSNLGWNVRLPRITRNLLKHGNPDVVLLQEATDEMCYDIVKAMGTSYKSVKSFYGMGVRRDGYCHVLFNPLKFEMIPPATTRTQENHQRFVGVLLRHLKSERRIFVASTHLPADGSAPVANIKSIIETVCVEDLPVVIGGDFNVTRNPFSPELQNLSGEAATFYNDESMHLDWVVGRRVHAVGKPIVNSIQIEQGRWPNETEGSDHTAVFVRVAFQ